MDAKRDLPDARRAKKRTDWKRARERNEKFMMITGLVCLVDWNDDEQNKRE